MLGANVPWGGYRQRKNRDIPDINPIETNKTGVRKREY